MVGLVFVLSDLVGYFVHRAMHRVPMLWRFHKLHHEATQLSWLDAWRQHPVDFVLHWASPASPIDAPDVYAVGVPSDGGQQVFQLARVSQELVAQNRQLAGRQSLDRHRQ